MEVPVPETLARLPLAEAVLTLWRLAADADTVNQIFDENRGRCYEKILLFSTIVGLNISRKVILMPLAIAAMFLTIPIGVPVYQCQAAWLIAPQRTKMCSGTRLFCRFVNDLSAHNRPQHLRSQDFRGRDFG